MADSIEGIVPLLHMTDEQYRDADLPGRMLRPVDLATGEPARAFQSWVTVKSPLTGLGFQVKGVWQAVAGELNTQPNNAGGGPPPRLIGYYVRINVPSAVVGNNCLLRNGVPKACELAVLMLKLWMLDEGAPAWVVQSIDFERMRLTMVTPTFLHRFPTHGQAQAALLALRVASEIRNKPKFKIGKRDKASRPAFSVGTLADATVYVKERAYAIVAYLKSRYAPSAAEFATKQDEVAVLDEAELHVRAETQLHATWLRENRLDRPEDWRLYGDDAAYRKAYALIRRSLRLDEGLRGNEPTEEDIKAARLVADDLTLLRFHLAAGNVQSHPLVLAKPTLKAQQQYFSDVKLRLSTRLGVDITVEWAVQKAAISAGVSAWLHYPGMYAAPPGLEDLSFSEASVAQALNTLQTLLAERVLRAHPATRLPRTLSDIVLADEDDARLIDLGELEISEQARRALDKFQMPLHRLLECHSLGCFGDISVEEATRLSEAARNGKAVTSRYVLGDRAVLVTSERLAGAGQDAMRNRTMVTWVDE